MNKHILVFLLILSIISLVSAEQLNKYNSNITEISTVKIKPLGGSVGETKKYPAGANAVGGPGTSGIKGSVSIGLGSALVALQNPEPSQSDIESYMFPMSVTYGLSKQSDISLSVPYSYTKLSENSDLDGFGDMILTANHSYLKQEDFGFGLGFSLSAVCPTGEKKIVGEDNDLDFILNTKFEKKWNSNAFNLNLSYTYQDLGRKADDSVFGLGAALSRGFSNSFSASLELVTNDIRDTNGDYNSIFFVGMRFMSDKESISILLGKNIDNSDINYIAISSYSYSF